MYIVVDIETTGGKANQNGITEVAAVKTDGKRIIDTFQTLVRPQEEIPPFIVSMTGITNEMVANAPLFADIADELFAFLNENIFVAHNVSFDYNFIKNHFKALGIDFSAKRLCTVKISRKIYPGLNGYGLGKLCTHFNINNHARHRAMGDAYATTLLFHQMLAADHKGMIEKMLKNKNGELKLPPNISYRQFRKLPEATGVYYFHDKAGKVIYVGKAINIKKRVTQHFNNGFVKRNLLGLMSRIYEISYEITGSELAALLLELSEIKKWWPDFNNALKKRTKQYAIIHFTDRKGYEHLAIDKQHGAKYELQLFPNLITARQALKRIVAEYALCYKFCGLVNTQGACPAYHQTSCKGACIGRESISHYNKRVYAAMQSMQTGSESFFLIDRGRHAEEQTVVAVEHGEYLGFGYIDSNDSFETAESLRSVIKVFPGYPEAKNIINAYLPKLPANRQIFVHNATH